MVLFLLGIDKFLDTVVYGTVGALRGMFFLLLLEMSQKLRTKTDFCRIVCPKF